LEDGELFAIILFSKVRVPEETASLFRTVALSVKAALVAVGGDRAPRSTAGPAPRVAAKDQLLAELEQISSERFKALERALAELDQQTRELRISREALRRANAEIEQRASEAIRVSEARLGRLWESAIIGVMYADAYGTITDANDEVLRMIGYTRDD